MTKEVTCPVCNGYGFTVITSENSMQSHVCDNCNGSGELEVPMTNGDRIRSMTDEELVNLLGYRCMCSVVQDDHRDICVNQACCEGCLLEWLKQPVEEGP